MSLRKAILAVALVATLVASVVDFQSPDDVMTSKSRSASMSGSTPTSRPMPASASTPTSASASASKLASAAASTTAGPVVPRSPSASPEQLASVPAGAAVPISAAANFSRMPFPPQSADLFAVHSWQPPPPPPPKAAPASAPTAPALPFRYLGKVLEQGQVVAFLALGSRTHLLRQGDVVAEYRVLDVTPTEMTFMYLPLNQQQRLTFGSAN